MIMSMNLTSQNNVKIVVPTIRESCYQKFYKFWKNFGFEIIKVVDGPDPTANGKSVKQIMGKDADLIYNLNDGVRNLGFAYVARYHPECEVIVTLDDDTKPIGNTLADHLRALDMRVCTSWMKTTSSYTRGFPYGIREEAEVVLSHGLWEGVKDWDAPSQLAIGNPDVDYVKSVIPKGIYYPMCGMNIAFKRKLLPYMYFAPMGPRVGIDRFADIWCGIESKKVIDANGWAVVSGFAKVKHERASNVFSNLVKEAKALGMNEKYGEDDYFKLYSKQRQRWMNFICKYL